MNDSMIENAKTALAKIPDAAALAEPDKTMFITGYCEAGRLTSVPPVSKIHAVALDAWRLHRSLRADLTELRQLDLKLFTKLQAAFVQGFRAACMDRHPFFDIGMAPITKPEPEADPQGDAEEILGDMRSELLNAVLDSRVVQSHHEAYGLLAVQMQNLLGAVLHDDSQRRRRAAFIAIAAIALRAISDLQLPRR